MKVTDPAGGKIMKISGYLDTLFMTMRICTRKLRGLIRINMKYIRKNHIISLDTEKDRNIITVIFWKNLMLRVNGILTETEE